MLETSGIIQLEDTTIMHKLIPKPASVFEFEESFVVSANTKIILHTGSDDITSIGNLLAGRLTEVSVNEIPVLADDHRGPKHDIHLLLNGDASLGEEGYELSVTADSVQLGANCPAGLFIEYMTFPCLLVIA